MPKLKLSPVVYKKSKHFKKFIAKSKQKLLKSTASDKGNKISLTTLLTNDECNTSEEFQMYVDGSDYFKVMNSKEAAVSTTCDDKNNGNDDVDTLDDDDDDDDCDDNKTSVASSCYASIPTDNGSDKAIAGNNVNDCCDDTNNHSNNNGNNKRSTAATNDNKTNVASNTNHQCNKQILNKDEPVKGTTKIANKKHHKLSIQTNASNEEQQQQYHVASAAGDDAGDKDEHDKNENKNYVVDNSNVDNVIYNNKYHKTYATQQQTTAITHDSTIPPCMSLKTKQNHLLSFPPFQSSTACWANNSSSLSLSLENCEHHKIKKCEIHQQQQAHGHIQNSIVQQLGTFVSNYKKALVDYGRKSTGCRIESTTTSMAKCELASPRCQSRESTASVSANNEVRCPSNESHYSGHEGHTPGETPAATSPPVGLPLPATLAPAAAAALLPPQSAAMAAYFNAAAAAAAQQNHHLLLTNPLAAAASLVQQATQQQQQQQQIAHSPNSQQTLTPTPPNANDLVDASALDFSTKRSRRQSDDDANGSEEYDEDNADAERNDNEADNVNDNEADDLNSPLDLSVNNGRKRQSDEDEPVIITNRKLARSNDYKSLPASSTWVPPINPYLAAVAAANMSPKTPLSLDWNAKAKIAPNEATKALEKMTEMTRLGGSVKADHNEISTRHSNHSTNASSTATTASNGRHSAWQSHWLNKGADAVKDVFKCVWCKQSFATLASLTTHMKETQHCGVNVPPSVGSTAAAAAANSGGNQTTQSAHHSRHSATQNSCTTSAQQAAIVASNSTASGGSKSDLNMLIKETMPLPRKLVRGQDVWLGKGAEQTRQILKCMWCGQSFRSLAEMTSHMQETQHYTNIISQEQIISWKSTDEKSSRDNSSGSSGGSNRTSSHATASSNSNTAVNATVSNSSTSPTASAANSNSTVSAVLTCKVCDQAFSTLKDLSNHMMKNNHYKEHMMRTAAATESVPTMIRGRGRQAREKRKKSLPVRKLLEMERAQHDFKAAGLDQALKPLRDFAVSTKLSCETCGDKVETALFVDHIRQCIDRSLVLSPRSQNNNNNNNNNNSTLKSPYGNATPQECLNSPQTPHSRSDGRKTSDDNSSPLSLNNTRADILCPLPPTEAEKTTGGPSVLNALEQLIEKSFDSRSRHSSGFGGDNTSGNTPLGSSILKRLGIDDNVDYTKPLMDPQTMQFLRSYSSYQPNRDRSASESSSVSERCSSRLESFTPERCHDLSRQPTPRLTPDKTYPSLKETRDNLYSTKIKSEPIESNDHPYEADNIPINEIPKKISVKKEFNMPEDHEDLEGHKIKNNDMRHIALTPSSGRVISPSISERSVTPKSTCSSGEKKPHLGFAECSSLNALSSMFNNLNNTATTITATASSPIAETNNNNSATAVGKKSNANPLAALQKLCETTDTPAANTRSSAGCNNNNNNNNNNNLTTHSASSSASANSGFATNGGAGAGAGVTGSSNNAASMLAFSWACNDAVITADSVIKCSFCDTPFSSKGAYRHHLSKVHFVKDEQQHYQGDLHCMKSPAAISPKSITSPRSVTSAKSPSSSSSTAQQRLATTPPSSVAITPTINPYDESPQSKFLKYTELAKQLSSRNA